MTLVALITLITLIALIKLITVIALITLTERWSDQKAAGSVVVWLCVCVCVDLIIFL